MAIYYGSALSDSFTALPNTTYQAPADKVGSRLRYDNFHVTVPSGTDFAISDELRIGRLSSSDRIVSMRLSCGTFPASTTISLGLYDIPETNSGAVVDIDLFASGQVLTTALTREEALTEAATIADTDRGKRLWEMLALGAGSDTADPRKQWDLVLTWVSTNPAATGSDLDILVEVEFVAGS